MVQGFQVIPSICQKCNTPHDSLYPLGGGVCGACLVKNFTLREALKATCSCLHSEIKSLYQKK